jgi:hypothetical protein
MGKENNSQLFRNKECSNHPFFNINSKNNIVNCISRYIDQFTILTGVVRTSCEASNDGTLIVYYPFDTNGTFFDYSMNFFHGSGLNIQYITFGRLRQAIAFNSSTKHNVLLQHVLLIHHFQSLFGLNQASL